MNIGKFTGALKAVGLFLLSNITAILFLIGLASICYAVFLFHIVWGYVAVGLCLVIVAMILTAEGR